MEKYFMEKYPFQLTFAKYLVFLNLTECCKIKACTLICLQITQTFYIPIMQNLTKYFNFKSCIFLSKSVVDREARIV